MNEELIAKRAKQLLLFDIPVENWPEGITEELKVALFEEIKNNFETRDLNIDDIGLLVISKQYIISPPDNKNAYNVVAMMKGTPRMRVLKLPITITV